MRAVLASIALLSLATGTSAHGTGFDTDTHGRHSEAPTPFVEVTPPGGEMRDQDDWEALGPFGGDMEAVAVSPVDPMLVLAGLAPAGGGAGALYRSTDAGVTWSKVPALDGISVHDVEYAGDGTVYIGTIESAWKSIDGGASWTQLALGIGTSDAVYEVALDPSNPNTIWIGIADAMGSQPVNVMRSTDGGGTWEDLTPPHDPMTCRGIALDPQDARNVYACFGGSFGGGEVWVSRDGGATWTDRTAGLPPHPMNDMEHDGARALVGGGQLFGSQDVGVYATSDYGATWVALHDDTWPLLVIHDLDIDPNDPKTILAASAGAGVFRTTDGGLNWDFSVGGTGSASLNSVRFEPYSSDVVFLGASSLAVLKSIDGGEEFVISATGIGALSLYAIEANAADPAEMAIAFQGQNDGGVYTTLDGGTSWTLEPLPPTRYSDVQFAPDGTLYVISDGPSTIAPEGLYRRNPDGTWTGIGPDQGTQFESQLVCMRFSANDPHLIVAGGSDFGVADFEATVWLTLDGGGAWSKTYEGDVDGESVTDIEIIEDGTDQLIIASFTDLGEFQDGGVLRSTDGGARWDPSSTGLPVGVQAANLCVSPSAIKTFYLADQDYGTGNGGLYVTSDGGQTWAGTGYAGVQVYDVVCNPYDDQVLYISQAGNDQVMRSADQGATFLRFNHGLSDAGSPRDLAYQGGESPRLLLATSTGSYATGLDVPQSVDVDVRLDFQIRPNPSRAGAVLAFELREPARVRLNIVDPSGRRVASLCEGLISAGRHVVPWSEPATTGRYFARLAVGDRIWTRELTRIR